MPKMTVHPERLKVMREVSGKCKTRLARESGISTRTIRRLEQPVQASAAVRSAGTANETTVKLLAKSLGVTPDELTGIAPLPRWVSERADCETELLRTAEALITDREAFIPEEQARTSGLFDGDLRWSPPVVVAATGAIGAVIALVVGTSLLLQEFEPETESIVTFGLESDGDHLSRANATSPAAHSPVHVSTPVIEPPFVDPFVDLCTVLPNSPWCPLQVPIRLGSDLCDKGAISPRCQSPLARPGLEARVDAPRKPPVELNPAEIGGASSIVGRVNRTLFVYNDAPTSTSIRATGSVDLMMDESSSRFGSLGLGGRNDDIRYDSLSFDANSGDALARPMGEDNMLSAKVSASTSMDDASGMEPIGASLGFALANGVTWSVAQTLQTDDPTEPSYIQTTLGDKFADTSFVNAGSSSAAIGIGGSWGPALPVN